MQTNGPQFLMLAADSTDGLTKEIVDIPHEQVTK